MALFSSITWTSMSYWTINFDNDLLAERWDQTALPTLHSNFIANWVGHEFYPIDPVGYLKVKISTFTTLENILTNEEVLHAFLIWRQHIGLFGRSGIARHRQNGAWTEPTTNEKKASGGKKRTSRHESPTFVFRWSSAPLRTPRRSKRPRNGSKYASEYLGLFALATSLNEPQISGVNMQYGHRRELKDEFNYVAEGNGPRAEQPRGGKGGARRKKDGGSIAQRGKAGEEMEELM
ncbi:hypothetical protein DFH06DRAFT_1150068 [Mycena polygramma]|nr:hypothetical protein DFH06DRAFT_1150068 [Mycena polygramma]